MSKNLSFITIKKNVLTSVKLALHDGAKYVKCNYIIIIHYSYTAIQTSSGPGASVANYKFVLHAIYEPKINSER